MPWPLDICLLCRTPSELIKITFNLSKMPLKNMIINLVSMQMPLQLLVEVHEKCRKCEENFLESRKSVEALGLDWTRKSLNS